MNRPSVDGLFVLRSEVTRKSRPAIKKCAQRIHQVLFLALRQAAKKWTMPIHHWREALNHFTILWPERMPAPGESCTTKRSKLLNHWAGEGVRPLPLHSIPETNPDRLHKSGHTFFSQSF